MMKRYRVVMVALSLLAGTGFSQAVSYLSLEGAYPVQLSLFPPAQLVHHTQDVAGLRLGLITANHAVSALDIGLVNWSTSSWRGGGIGAANLVHDDSSGVMIGFLNYVEGVITGFQGGFFNQSDELRGVQGGLINVVYDAEGAQLGLYNNSNDFCGLQVGGINIGYKMAHGVQIGLFNRSPNFTGLQIGIINYTRVLEGLQIGLINIAVEKQDWPILPIVNWVF